MRRADGQVDQQRAAEYFKEAAALCEREGGRLWGISLCGPMVMADAATKTVATNQPAPDAKQPPALGFANSAMDWGGTRWSTYVWQMIPPNDSRSRAVLFMHELYHRVQPQLGFTPREGPNDHLDTPEGRYWLTLEWRALSKALSDSTVRRQALADALAFRHARRAAVSTAAENERLIEINEGMAQYTGTVAGNDSHIEAVRDAIQQLAVAERSPSYLRNFAYPLGAAYGLLLDVWSPGWTRRLKPSDDIGALTMAAAGVQPASNAETAAGKYDGPALRIAEAKREADRQARLADLRKRFIEGPVLVLPGTRSASFSNAGMTPVPGAGMIYPTYRTTADWGSLEATIVLVAPDRKLTLPAPATISGTPIRGDGWTLTPAAGWVIRPGSRTGDFQLVKDSTAKP
jgi:hypothetical protein